MNMPEVWLALGGSPELSMIAKATALLAAGLIATRLAAHAKASVRHLMLGATFASVLALPVVIATSPKVPIEVPVSSFETAQPLVLTVQPTVGPAPIVVPAEAPGWEPPSWLGLARMIWVGGIVAQLLLLGWHLVGLGRIRRAGIPWLERREYFQQLAGECGVGRPVDVLLHEGIATPITCGVLHSVVLLPMDARDWSDDELRRALIHELEHVRRGDWAMQLAARATTAIYWFHPLVWSAWRRLRLEAERAADDAVVCGAGCADYAEQLVMLAKRMSETQTHAALGMANRSDLSARVSALLDATQRRGRAGLLAAAGTVAAAGLMLFSIAPVTAVAQSPDAHRASALDRALYEASEDGDLRDIDSLLNAGANVNAVIRGDGSPLIGAARKGNLAAVARLLDRGADPNMPVAGDGNPLIVAAAKGHAEVVSLLLDRGARIDEVVTSDENALIQASHKGQLQVVKLLVGRRANVNARVWVEESIVAGGVVGGVVGGVPGGVAGGVVGGVPGGVAGGVPGAVRQNATTSGEWRSPLIMARKGGHQAVVDFLIASGARE